MKIRTNFVSNSSSSSFIILATQKEYDRIVATLNETIQEDLKPILPLRKINVFGRDLVEITGCVGSITWIASGDKSMEDGEIWEVKDAFKKAFDEGADVYVGGVDC